VGAALLKVEGEMKLGLFVGLCESSENPFPPKAEEPNGAKSLAAGVEGTRFIVVF